MANARRNTRTTEAEHDSEAAEQAERLSQSLSDTAQQIWLAGVGALSRAQAEGTRLFEGIVKEGLNLEQSAVKFADTQSGVVREAIGSGVDAAAERAAGTWSQLETAVEGAVRRTLSRLGVPDRDEMDQLRTQVDFLSAQIGKRRGAVPGAARKTTARKAAKSATSRAPAKPAKKAAAKRSSKKTAKAAKATRSAAKSARKVASARD
ncbi:MAG: phasin family protein [Pseudomonadota bacterium]|nr:phasin family protein [Pseudomonadota bacterium]